MDSRFRQSELLRNIDPNRYLMESVRAGIIQPKAIQIAGFLGHPIAEQFQNVGGLDSDLETVLYAVDNEDIEMLIRYLYPKYLKYEDFLKAIVVRLLSANKDIVKINYPLVSKFNYALNMAIKIAWEEDIKESQIKTSLSKLENFLSQTKKDTGDSYWSNYWNWNWNRSKENKSSQAIIYLIESCHIIFGKKTKHHIIPQRRNINGLVLFNGELNPVTYVKHLTEGFNLLRLARYVFSTKSKLKVSSPYTLPRHISQNLEAYKKEFKEICLVLSSILLNLQKQPEKLL